MAQLNGTENNDTLLGTDDSDYIYGYAGHDTLSGDAGDDWLVGGAGNDILDGGTGEEDHAAYYLWNAGNVAAFSASAVEADGSGSILDGLGGIDTLMNIESIYVGGSDYDDQLTGSVMDDHIRG